MELWVAAGVDGSFKQGTEKVVKEDTEVLNNVVVLVDITKRKKGSNYSSKLCALTLLNITVMKSNVF